LRFEHAQEAVVVSAAELGEHGHADRGLGFGQQMARQRLRNALERRAGNIRCEQLPDAHHRMRCLPAKQVRDLLRRQGLKLPRRLVRVIEEITPVQRQYGRQRPVVHGSSGSTGLAGGSSHIPASASPEAASQ
jgi:hypothetical protein